MTETAQPRPTPHPPASDFDLVLRPHRSLSPTGFWVVMAILAVWSFVGGIVFWIVGAWPVIGFVGLDFALVWWAFRASYGDVKAHERLRLADGAFIVDRVDKRGAAERHTFPSYWLRVTLEPARAGSNRLVLSSHGRTLAVGSFLPPAERVALADLIAEALDRARRPPAPEGPAPARQPAPRPSTSFMP